MSLLDTLDIVTGHFISVVENGEIIACLEYDWVKDYEDMLRADAGKELIGGEVLFISNMRIKSNHQGYIWKLRKKLPLHRYISGFVEGTHIVRAPRGLPGGFYGQEKGNINNSSST